MLFAKPGSLISIIFRIFDNIFLTFSYYIYSLDAGHCKMNNTSFHQRF